MKLINTDALANQLCWTLSRCDYGVPIAIDCETTGLRPYQGDTIRGFSLAFRSKDSLGQIESYYIPVAYPEGNLSQHWVEQVVDQIFYQRPLYVFHHAKFDIRFLRQIGLKVTDPKQLWCSKIVAWLMDENLSNSLDPQAKLYLGAEKSTYMTDLLIEKGTAALKAEGFKGRVPKTQAYNRGWREITAEETAEYGANDAELTLRLYEYQRHALDVTPPTLHGNPREDVQREMQVQLMLLDIEDAGIMVDSGRVKELLDAAVEEAQGIEEFFWKNYSVAISSNPQLAKLLYDVWQLDPPSKTKGGARSVARQALEQLQGDKRFGEYIRMLIRHRRLQKMITAYLRPLLEYVADDDRVHPVFWQTGTVTGRFSCSEPNLQTIPRGDTLEGVRDVFIAAEGYELWEYDLQAAELRVMAGWAEEPRLIEQLEQGIDMHAENAKAIFGANFTGLQRRASKNIMYGWSYGLNSRETAARYITGPETTFEQATKLADEILKGIKRLYPKLFKLMQKQTRLADQDGIVLINERWPGRYRRFITEAALKPKTYTALNAQVQGGIGEFMKDVMLATHMALLQCGHRIVLQVHDSLVIEVREGQGEVVREALQAAADEINPFKMRMIFDGKRWGDHE